jgi:very-short-patch-repair endonuclease
VSYRASDIGYILKLENVRGSIIKYDSTEKHYIVCDSSISKGKNRQTYVHLSHKGLEKLLFSSRSDEVIKLVELMGIQSVRKWFPSIENDTMLNIIEAFKCENIKRQYMCDKYRIDLYFIDYNIAVECDELQHNIKINKQHDLLREDFIKRKLKCEFIRFKPYEKDFNIFELIGKIHSKMIECIKSGINVTEEEIENYNTLSAAIKSKNMMRDKSDNKYHIEGKIYEKIRGTREEVWCGTAYQTTGELKKRDLEMNKHGRVVSKVKLITATMDNNFIKNRGTKFPLITNELKSK